MASHHYRRDSEDSETRRWRGLLERLLKNPELLPYCWACRRRAISDAIERDAADLESVRRLFEALGEKTATTYDQTACERMEIRAARPITEFLDQSLLRSFANSGLLQSNQLINRLCLLWLGLEAHYAPDERGWLADLRDQLVRTATELEIDLGELGI